MQYKKELTVTKNGKREVYVYYVRKAYSENFSCEMYNVGIISEGKATEIEDFSLTENEATLFCDYLYENNATWKNIFLMGEEFILNSGI